MSSKEGYSLFKAVFAEGDREIQVFGNLDRSKLLVNRIKIETVYEIGKTKSIKVQDATGEYSMVDVEITDVRYQPFGDRWCIVVYCTHDDHETPLFILPDVQNCKMWRDADSLWGFSLIEL